jgi:hypothetical protein
MRFGLKRKKNTVKTGNMSTQAVATAESERISRLLKKSKNKRGIRAKKAKKKAIRLINQQTPTRNQTSFTQTNTTTTVATKPLERTPVETVELYSVSPSPVVIQESTVSTTNSSTTKPSSLRYTNDVLDLSETNIKNSQFEPIEKYGITSLRPEILCISNFVPVVFDQNSQTELTDAGRLLRLQHQILNIRNETLKKTIDSMDAWNSIRTQESISNIKNDFEKFLSGTQKTIEYFDKFINALENAEEGLNIKKVRYSAGLKVLSLESFFEKTLQYSKQKQRYFSNSKMYLQMCSDFRAVLENYSFNLLNLSDPDRLEDFDPINIDNTYTTKDGFVFSIDAIRSLNSPENASSAAIFTKTMNSLPTDLGDRIKLLITLLSKEYRVSKNMGTNSIASILSSKFSQADSGNPFDNIVGIPGNTILDIPVGEGSLSSLVYLPVSNNSTVLPFETKYIDSPNKGKTYIPGSNYFFDTILSTANNRQFNTKPFVDYVDLANRIVSDSENAIKSLLNLNSKETSRIDPDTMLKSFLESVNSSINGIVSAKSINKDQATVIALYKLANSDTKLKNMLFQFLIFSGIATQNRENNKIVFQNLARELKSSTAISYARIVANLAVDLTDTKKLGVLQSYLQILATDIEDRVFLLVSGREIPNRSTGNQTTQQLETDNNYLSFDILGNVDFNPDRRIVFLNEGDIRTILMTLVVPGSVASTTLFSEFLNMSNEITLAASTSGISSYLLPDQTGRTRYNFLSTSMQLLLIFEIISSLSNKYTFVEFSKTRYKNKLALDVDTRSNNFVRSSISDLLGIALDPSETRSVEQVVQARSVQNFADSWNAMVEFARTGIMPQQQTAVTISGNPEQNITVVNREQTPPGQEHTELALGLRTILTKVDEENKVINDFILLFKQIATQLSNTKTVLLNTFNTESIISFLEEGTIDELSIARNPTQLRLASFLLSEFNDNTTSNQTENSKEKQQNNYDSIIVNDVPSEQQMKLMFAMLKEPEFGFATQADERLRIVSIGIPAGFAGKLSDRINSTKIQKESFFQKQSDVVRINVYKTDMRFEDIVFKPKSFIFDLSLFQPTHLLNNIEPRDGESFNLLQNRFQIADFQNPKHKKFLTVESIQNNNTYSFLSKEQKRNMVKNHVQSSLLELYIRLMSNLKIREDAFSEEIYVPGSNVNVMLLSTVKDYIQNVYDENLGNATIQQILENENINIGVRDTIKLFAYGSKAFEPQLIRQEIVSSKLFDRIFHIPVSTEGFELDLELTRRTESGRKALLQNFIQQRIIEGNNNKLIFSNQSPKDAQADVVFADFFVTVESDF